MLEEQAQNRKKKDATFVPTNMAVNFVQHNRCKICFMSIGHGLPMVQMSEVPIYSALLKFLTPVSVSAVGLRPFSVDSLDGRFFSSLFGKVGQSKI